MTGLIPEKDFSRRSFIKGGGMMIVGIGTAGAMGGTAKAAGVPFDAFASPGPADPNSPDSFLTIHSDNTASLRSGRIELGQGATVGLMIIAAEELNMDNSQLVHVAFDTGGAQPSPNTGNTGGSSSITTGGPLVRMAAAQAYQALLGLASTNLGVPVAQLSVSKGVVSGGGKTVTYGQLIGDKLLNVKYAGTTLTAGQAPAKPVAQYTQVGIARPPRYDIPIIVNGSKVYAANVRVPGMIHGRIVRPRGQGAYGDGSTPVPLSIDQSSIAHIPGVQIIQKGNFLGVVAPKEYDAIQAAALLKVAWKDPPTISPVGNFWQGMRTFDSTGQIAAKYSVNNGNVDSAIAGAAKTVAMTAKYHYQMHGPIGPNVAVADVNATGAIIYSHVKDGYGTSRPKIAAVLGLPLNRVRIVYYEGSSSFGGGAIHVDTGESAALMSQAVGKPVRVQYMRWDEHGWDNYGQAMMFDMRGGVDPAGQHHRARLHRLRDGRLLGHPRRVADRHAARGPELDRRRIGHEQHRNAVQRRDVPAPLQPEDGADAEQLLQDVDAPGSERAAGHIRGRAADRPARLRGEHGSVPVPAPEHHAAEGERRLQPVA